MKILIKDININYEIEGNGKPIILIHGYYPDHRLMKGCMEHIFEEYKNFKRIYIDLPGMGLSQSSEKIKNSDDMLDIVIEFIKKVIPDEKFLIAGESYGGYLTLGVINKMSEKVDGALLICPVIIANPKKRTLPKHIVLEKEESLIIPKDEFGKSFEEFSVIQNEEIFKRYLNEVCEGVKLADIKFLERIFNTGYEFSSNSFDEMSSFDKPSLFIMGRQDSVVGYKDAWDILDKFPRTTFAVVDKAGHNLQIEQKEIFDSLVKEWLNRVEKY
jgi:pimeloyl-ACP methyl ester carboxylesterase